MEGTESCKAVLEQGEKKGQRCWRPQTKNGYCGKHQAQATLEEGKQNNKKKCRKYRCINLIDKDSEDVYCKECLESKQETKKTQTLCNAKIEQGKNKGKQCDKLATNGDYCGKHFQINTLREEADNKGIRICDDGKRACKNPTIDNKLKCEECLSKIREKEINTYNERKESGNSCVTCGKNIKELCKGFRSDTIQQCKSCYDNSRNTELKRDRNDRNYKERNKENILSYYNQYIRSASSRNIVFDLSIDYFEEIINKSCEYCGHQKENEANGIDRVNSGVGYILENCVPCCSKCNIMKNDLSREEFMRHITKIYIHNQTVSEKKINSVINPQKNSFIRPSEVVKLYTSNKLDDYLKQCSDEGRSPLFIQKLKDSKDSKVSESEFRTILKNALISEYLTDKKTKENIRQRIPKKELEGYLDSDRSDLFINLYESVHGKFDGFEDDVKELSKAWKSMDNKEKDKMLNKLLIKYQNIRNRSS